MEGKLNDQIQNAFMIINHRNQKLEEHQGLGQLYFSKPSEWEQKRRSGQGREQSKSGPNPGKHCMNQKDMTLIDIKKERNDAVPGQETNLEYTAHLLEAAAAAVAPGFFDAAPQTLGSRIGSSCLYDWENGECKIVWEIRKK